MKTKLMQNKKRTLLQASLATLMVMGLSGATLAQERVGISRGNEINVPCCNCGENKSTVIDLSTGVAPWTSASGPVSTINTYPGWKTPTAPTKWVYTGTNNPGTYTYNLKINVPKNCAIAPHVSFSGTGWGDNNITVKLDDKTLGTTPVSSGGKANYGFRDPYGVNVNGGIGAGSHTLSVTVRNDDSVTGFLFDGKLKIECMSKGLYTHGDKPEY